MTISLLKQFWLDVQSCRLGKVNERSANELTVISKSNLKIRSQTKMFENQDAKTWPKLGKLA